MIQKTKPTVDLLYKDEVYAIVGAAMEVYNQLGPGFAEAVYQEALSIELQERNIPFVEQQPIQISYKGIPLRQRYIPDFLVYDKIIVEIKAIKQLGLLEQGQILNYLKATGLRLGLLINFGNNCKLNWERKIL
ncbi:MAG: GxxExxY protein [Anaerolineae bacterium]